MGGKSSKQILKESEKVLAKPKVNVYQGHIRDIPSAKENGKQKVIYTFKEDYDEIMRRQGKGFQLSKEEIEQEAQHREEQKRMIEQANDHETKSSKSQSSIQEQIMTGKRTFSNNSGAFMSKQSSGDAASDKMYLDPEENEEQERPKFTKMMYEFSDSVEEITDDPNYPIQGTWPTPPNKRDVPTEAGENQYHPNNRFPGTWRSKDAEILFETLRRLRRNDITERNQVIAKFAHENGVEEKAVRKLVEYTNTFVLVSRDAKKFGFWSNQTGKKQEDAFE